MLEQFRCFVTLLSERPDIKLLKFPVDLSVHKIYLSARPSRRSGAVGVSLSVSSKFVS